MVCSSLLPHLLHLAQVAIFKPCDEEPLAPNNPKGYVGRTLGDAGWKPTVRVGEVNPLSQ